MPDQIVNALVQAGPLGLWVLWWIWRDAREQQREDRREQARVTTFDKMSARLDTNTEALNHLVQLSAIEVLSRPNVVARTRDEVEALQRAVEERRRQRPNNPK